MAKANRVSDDCSIDDARDLRDSLGGDHEAYARLVRRHQAAIERFLARFVRHPGVREELLQEVFVQAWFSLSGFRGESPLVYWLRRIAVRATYAHWKRLGSRRTVPIDDGALQLPADTDALAPAEAAELLDSVMGRLPPRDRMVLALMHLEGHSVQETAFLLGWTQGMVKVQSMRARRKLRRLLEARGHHS